MRAACLPLFGVALVSVVACGGRETKAGPVETKALPPPPSSASLEVLTAHRVRESSGIVVGKIGERMVVLLADADDHAIRVFDATTLEPLAQTMLEGEPRDLLTAVDGRVFVSMPERNEILTLAAQDASGALREIARTRTAVEPIGMALTPAEDRLLVVSGASHRVEAFTTATMERAWSIAVAREPRAVIVASDGKRAFVSHAVASHATVIPLGDAEPTAITKTRLDFEVAHLYTSSTPARSSRLAYSMTRLQGKEGELIAMPLVQEASWGGAPSGYGYDDTPVSKLAADSDPFGDRGCRYVPGQWAHQGRSSFDVRTLHAKDGTIRERPGTRDTTRRCLIPRATIAAGDRVFVACEGDTEVMRVRFEDGWAWPDGGFEVGRGPSAIARVPATARAIVWSGLARTLSSIDLGVEKPRKQAPSASIEVERLRGRDAKELAGREIFRRSGDDRISNDGIACASCHPDGRDDDLVWTGPHGKRKPPALAGNEARRGPFGWGGEHASITDHMAQTLKRLGGKGLEPEPLEALASYLRSMKPIPIDTAAAENDAIARHGKEVFESDRAACATCHGVKDREPHDVGSGGSFVTPALAGVGARRALFHDGRFDSLEALLKGSPRMGGAADLREDDRTALVAYLRTL